MRHGLRDLDVALSWIRDRWHGQRPIPLVLHQSHETEGALGAPPFTHRFQAALDGSAEAYATVTMTTQCGHPLLVRGSDRDCPECFGAGIKNVRVDRYCYPMSRALSRLRGFRGQPHPVTTLLTLAEHGWDVTSTARTLGIDAPRILRAIRQLHSQYEEGPITTQTSGSWVDLSEAQQNAITAAEAMQAA